MWRLKYAAGSFHYLQFKSLLYFICNHSRNCKGRSSSRGRCISHMKNAISNNPISSIKYKIVYQISILIQSLSSYSSWTSAKPRVAVNCLEEIGHFTSQWSQSILKALKSLFFQMHNHVETQ